MLKSDTNLNDTVEMSGPVWEADYGSEGGDEAYLPVNKEFIIDRVESDSLMDALSHSAMDFEQLQLVNDQEIELQSRAFSNKSTVPVT